ncbi:MAG TPA: hypothetical protein VGB42_10235 [Candidatus Thermoplasmatota archaeon]
MSQGGPPDFGPVVLRHRVDASEFARLDWIALLAFLDIVMLGAGLFFVPRPTGPQAVYFGMWALFTWGIVRLAFARFWSSPALLLERGLYLPVYRPSHRLRLRRRAVAFAALRRVRLDASGYRSGSHVFETERGPVRCAKAYFPSAKRLASELKALAPHVEVVLVDARGRRRRFSPLVARRRAREPEGPRAGSK